MLPPVIFFVDDNDDACALFRAAADPTWEVRIFTNPLDALSAMVDVKPWVIVSDQNMDQMKGDQLLSLVRSMSPSTLRIMQTAHTEEALLLDSINKVQIADFIQKPWQPTYMRKRVELAIESYRSQDRLRRLAEESEVKDEEIKTLRVQLKKAGNELELFKSSSNNRYVEIENWAPAAIVWAIKNDKLPSAGRQTVATMVFVINTGILPDTVVHGRHLRAQIIQAYSDSVLRHSGWREALGGGITAAHFGLLGDSSTGVADSAMASALELKITLENLQGLAKVRFGCTLVLDIKDDVAIQVHTSIVNTPNGMATQKSLDVSDFNFAGFRKAVETLKQSSPEGISIYVTEEFKKRLKRFKLEFTEMNPDRDEGSVGLFKLNFADKRSTT